MILQPSVPLCASLCASVLPIPNVWVRWARGVLGRHHNPMLYFPDAPPLAHVWSGFDAADALFGCVGRKLLAPNLGLS